MIAVMWRIIVVFMWLVLAAQVSVYVRGLWARSQDLASATEGFPKRSFSKKVLIWNGSLAAVGALIAIKTRGRELFLPAVFLGMFFNGLSDYTIDKFRTRKLQPQI